MNISVKDIINLKKRIYSKLPTEDTKIREDIEEVFDTFIEDMENSVSVPKVMPRIPYETTRIPWVPPMSPTCTPVPTGSRPWDTNILYKTDAYVGTNREPWEQPIQTLNNN